MVEVIPTTEEYVDQAAKILSDNYFETSDEAKEHVLAKIKSKESFIAVIGDEVIGLMNYRRDYSHYANFMSDIVISKNHRRKRVATQLMKKFIEVCRKEQPEKQRFALSSTDVTNDASIKMHIKFGFKKLGVVKKLHFGKDEIIFGYDLRKE
ncbi:GNAT family N-acetyltransferase [Candidatus Woesearchaeota archaeon]|nr:GNAT family N-acetyltransferase [Candidatus Woesearchaeota archaeon]